MRPFLDQVRLLRHLRRGEWDQAVEVGAQLDVEALPERARALTGVALAWARIESGEDPAEVLEGVEPLEPGQPGWAPVHWPELLEFAEAHGLVRE